MKANVVLVVEPPVAKALHQLRFAGLARVAIPD
jgi:hypothetical protein